MPFKPRQQIKLCFDGATTSESKLNFVTLRAPFGSHEAKGQDEGATVPVEWVQQALLSFGTTVVAEDAGREEEWQVEDVQVQGVIQESLNACQLDLMELARNKEALMVISSTLCPSSSPLLATPPTPRPPLPPPTIAVELPVEELGPLIRKCLADGAMPAAALQELSHYLRCHFVPLSSPAAHQSRLPSLDMLLQRLQGVITKAGPHSPIALSILLRLLALSGDLNDWLFFGATLAMSTPAVAALRVDAGCQGHLTEFFRNVRHSYNPFDVSTYNPNLVQRYPISSQKNNFTQCLLAEGRGAPLFAFLLTADNFIARGKVKDGWCKVQRIEKLQFDPSPAGGPAAPRCVLLMVGREPCILELGSKVLLTLDPSDFAIAGRTRLSLDCPLLGATCDKDKLVLLYSSGNVVYADYAVPGRPPSTVKLCHVPGTLPKALPGSYRSASQMLPVHWAQRPFTLEGWANAALEGRAVLTASPTTGGSPSVFLELAVVHVPGTAGAAPATHFLLRSVTL
eukprot:EG_transcript_10000